MAAAGALAAGALRAAFAAERGAAVAAAEAQAALTADAEAVCDFAAQNGMKSMASLFEMLNDSYLPFQDLERREIVRIILTASWSETPFRTSSDIVWRN